MAGRLAGHQDVLGPGRACGEPGRGGTRPRPEAGTRDHPGQAAWSTRPGPAACSPRKRAAHQAVRGPAEDVPVLLRRPPPTSRTVAPHPTEQNQNTEQTTLAPDRLQRETEAGKIAVVPDNARPHHAKALTGLHGPGRLLERITTIFLPPYVPDHQPGRARPERGQERHRHHPARDTRRNPRRIRPIHRRPNIRPRLRAPSRPAKPETILLHDGHCFVTAMEGT